MPVNRRTNRLAADVRPPHREGPLMPFVIPVDEYNRPFVQFPRRLSIKCARRSCAFGRNLSSSHVPFDFCPAARSRRNHPHHRIFDGPVRLPADDHPRGQLSVALEEILQCVDRKALPEVPPTRRETAFPFRRRTQRMGRPFHSVAAIRRIPPNARMPTGSVHLSIRANWVVPKRVGPKGLPDGGVGSGPVHEGRRHCP